MTSAQPVLTLSDGKTIPQLGFGVLELGQADAAPVLAKAFEAGFRHIDTAQAYGNEKDVGAAVKRSGLDRGEIFFIYYLWTSEYYTGKARRSLEQSLERLGLDYLDLFLLHWPVPEHDGLFVEAWTDLIAAQEDGLVGSIGVSNFLPEHVARLVTETGVAPAVNQVELHPRFQQRDLRAAMEEYKVAVESYSPLGRGAMLSEPVLVDIAKAHGKSPAQVIIHWHLQEGLIVLPKTSSIDRVSENFDVFDFELSAEEMAVIAKLDKPQGKILSDPRHMNNLF